LRYGKNGETLGARRKKQTLGKKSSEPVKIVGQENVHPTEQEGKDWANGMVGGGGVGVKRFEKGGTDSARTH